MTWPQQVKLYGDRKLFHYEHVVAVSAIAEAMLEATSVEMIIEALKTCKICWILKEEDSELSKADRERQKAGGSRRRGQNEWREAYKNANIDFKYPW